MLQKMPFCAPPADRAEGIVSVQADIARQPRPAIIT
jgi:hypothetical protein